jgi:hypothetical protein
VRRTTGTLSKATDPEGSSPDSYSVVTEALITSWLTRISRRAAFPQGEAPFDTPIPMGWHPHCARPLDRARSLVGDGPDHTTAGARFRDPTGVSMLRWPWAIESKSSASLNEGHFDKGARGSRTRPSLASRCLGGGTARGQIALLCCFERLPFEIEDVAVGLICRGPIVHFRKP